LTDYFIRLTIKREEERLRKKTMRVKDRTVGKAHFELGFG